MNYIFDNNLIEELDSICNNIVARCHENNNSLSVMLCSSQKKEGVSTIASCLAKLISDQNGLNILLIDGNIAYPHLEKLLGLNESSDKNKKEPILEAGNFQAINKIDISHLNSQLAIHTLNKELLLDKASLPGSNECDLCAMIQYFKKIYNIIIVDAGSLQAPSPLMFSRYSDINILVIDVLKNNLHHLARIKKDIEHQGISLSSIILNNRKLYIPSCLYQYL